MHQPGKEIWINVRATNGRCYQFASTELVFFPGRCGPGPEGNGFAGDVRPGDRFRLCDGFIADTELRAARVTIVPLDGGKTTEIVRNHPAS